MLEKLNKALQRFLPILAPLSMLMGFLSGGGLAPYAFLIPWLFALMTFSAGLGLKLGEFRRVLSRPWFLLIIMALMHVLMPLLVLLSGSALYSDQQIVVGLVIIAVAPVGTSGLVWVGIYKGNLSLALSVVLLDTLLAPFIIPVILKCLVGAETALDSPGMTRSLFLMILLPTILAVFINSISGDKAGKALGGGLSLAAKFCILGILAVNGSLASAYFAKLNWLFASLILFVFCLCCAGYALSFIAGRLLFGEKPDVIAFMMCGGLRNVGSMVGMSILYLPAVTTFTVAIGMLFQQLMGYNAGLIAHKALREKPKTSRAPVVESLAHKAAALA